MMSLAVIRVFLLHKTSDHFANTSCSLKVTHYSLSVIIFYAYACVMTFLWSQPKVLLILPILWFIPALYVTVDFPRSEMNHRARIHTTHCLHKHVWFRFSVITQRLPHSSSRSRIAPNEPNGLCF